MVSETSIENYHQNIKGEHEEKQNEIIFEVIKKINPCTGRMVWKYLNGQIENSSVARSINNLKKHSKVVLCFKDKCKVSGVKAQYYSIL